MSNLSPDLIEEILSRVPATSLTRLRSTCKRWNTFELFRDRRFTEKHSRKAPKQSMVLMLKEYRIFVMSISLNVADPSREFKVPLGLKDSHSNLEKVYIYEAFHCGGLLLCKTNHDGLLVWNPGESRWIQPKSDEESYRWSLYCLGYENNNFCHSYKILRCLHKLIKFEIYEFSSDSWRVLDVAALVFRIESREGVSLKGNTYWLAFDTVDKFILSFDFTRERFRRFCLPVFQNLDAMALSVVREDKLLLLHRSFDTISKMDMWVTYINIDTEAVLWSKSFTLDIPISSTDGYIPNNFLVDEEKKVVMCCNRSLKPNSRKREYVIHKYHTESPSVDTTHASDFSFIFSYVPSLVQIQRVEEKTSR
ncbi:hypothetical protein EUTSA_v10015770mg [Eutrema salsugineum]|uniref:F-box domain-containing protein n=2 Tax=Eutrema salsugineum TaxID=72664 RepID=V4N9E2_EUTSA|nr:hypothetical protein EUTSA_v10015770mg [Eutrema salsugineum]